MALVSSLNANKNKPQIALKQVEAFSINLKQADKSPLKPIEKKNIAHALKQAWDASAEFGLQKNFNRKLHKSILFDGKSINRNLIELRTYGDVGWTLEKLSQTLEYRRDHSQAYEARKVYRELRDLLNSMLIYPKQ